jgi:hypothetical protein
MRVSDELNIPPEWIFFRRSGMKLAFAAGNCDAVIAALFFSTRNRSSP